MTASELLISVGWDTEGRRTLHAWHSYANLAAAYWLEWGDRGRTSDPGLSDEAPATEFVSEIVARHAIDVMTVLGALVDAAPKTEALRFLGAGLLEDLLCDPRSDETFLDTVEQAAAADPRFRTAFSGGWVGSDIDPDKRLRLLALGLVDGR